MQKGSLKLGQIHKPSSHKLQSAHQTLPQLKHHFSGLWKRPQLTITPTSGTNAMIPRRSGIWITQLGSTSSSPSNAKKTLDENYFRTAQKTTDREPLSFKIGNRVYFKNKQPGKGHLKWRPGYRIVCIKHVKIRLLEKTRSCNVKDVVLKPTVELWNIDMQFGRAGRYISHPITLTN